MPVTDSGNTYLVQAFNPALEECVKINISFPITNIYWFSPGKNKANGSDVL